jgi:hypothetical protein
MRRSAPSLEYPPSPVAAGVAVKGRAWAASKAVGLEIGGNGLVLSGDRQLELPPNAPGIA